MSFNSEIWIAISSAFVACFALAVTIWQGRQNHKHNKLSVKPLLGVLEHFEKIDENKMVTFFELQNTGFGPAMIKDFILIYDGQEVSKNNWKSYKENLAKIAHSFHINHYWFGPNSSMPADGKQELFSIEHKNNDDISFIEKLNIKINYQSLYDDETFTYDSRKDRLYHDARDAV